MRYDDDLIEQPDGLEPFAPLDPLPPEGEAIQIGHIRHAGKPIIAALARLSPEKGIDLLIEAAARLSAAGKPVSLVVAGDGPERANLERRAASLGIAQSVHFLGSVIRVRVGVGGRQISLDTFNNPATPPPAVGDKAEISFSSGDLMVLH